jgi:hypothetical protein
MARWTGLQARTGKVERTRVAVAGLIVLHFAICEIILLGSRLDAVGFSQRTQRKVEVVHKEMRYLPVLSMTFTTPPTTAKTTVMRPSGYRSVTCEGDVTTTPAARESVLHPTK